MSTTSTGRTAITDHEAAQIERANATTATPVVFVHGLWLLPSSWELSAKLFEEAGYAAVAPGWPDDPETVEEAKADPDVRAQERRPGGRLRRRDHSPAQAEAGGDRPFGGVCR